MARRFNVSWIRHLLVLIQVMKSTQIVGKFPRIGDTQDDSNPVKLSLRAASFWLGPTIYKKSSHVYWIPFWQPSQLQSRFPQTSPHRPSFANVGRFFHSGATHHVCRISCRTTALQRLCLCRLCQCIVAIRPAGLCRKCHGLARLVREILIC